MDCTIPVGVLRQLYTVRWFKGLTEVTPDDFLHITISDNGSLVITGVRVSDGSSGYSCTVNVTRDGGPVHRQGSPIALHVSSEYLFTYLMVLVLLFQFLVHGSTSSQSLMIDCTTSSYY